MTSLSEISSTIASIYDASATPSHWPDAIEAVARLCGAAGAAIAPVDGDVSRPIAALSYVSPEMAEAGDTYFSQWASEAPAIVQLRLAPIIGRATWDGELVDQDCAANHAFYNDFARSFGLRHGAMRVMSSGFLMLAPFSKSVGIPSDQQLMVFDALSLHIEKALSLGRMLEAGGLLFRSLEDALGRNGIGVALLDQEGAVVDLNDRARSMLGDGLTIESRRLIASRRTDQAKLAKSIGRGAPAVSILRMERSESTLPLILGVRRLGASDRESSPLLAVHGGFLITIVDPAAHPSIPMLALTELGLSPAEARVAIALSPGRSPEEVALRTGLAIHTVRNHLKRAFLKLGVSRQSELVALLSALTHLAEPESAPTLGQSAELLADISMRV